MSESLWPFSQEFRVWHTAPPDGPLSFFRLSNELHQANCPLKFQGSAGALSQLFDPNAGAPYPVDQYPHLNEEFVCWLQLPADVKGTEWYFGCVTFKRNRYRKLLFNEFRDLAARAGACLRQTPLFCEWLWPCMQYLSQADRHPTLFDGADAAWWIALLFTKPDILKPLHAACTRTDIQNVVRFEIENAASWSRDAIRSRQLDDEPLWPKVNCRIAPPFREIPCPTFFAVEDHGIRPPSVTAQSEGDFRIANRLVGTLLPLGRSPNEWTDWVLTKNAKKWFKAADVVTSDTGWTTFAKGIREEGRLVNHPKRGARMIRIHKSIFDRFEMKWPPATS